MIDDFANALHYYIASELLGPFVVDSKHSAVPCLSNPASALSQAKQHYTIYIPYFSVTGAS